jgi:alkylation response protein AidB-like acyl-CoA dehydrogenase
MPADLFQEMKSMGFFRMLVPKSYGGEGLGLVETMEILETLAAADGSTAWTTMIGVETPEIMSLLPRHTFEALYANGPDVTAGGAFAGQGEARVVEGGYRVSGRWPFVSGCQNWDYIFVNCAVFEEGKPLQSGPEGARAMLFRADQVEIEDTWHVLGLQGTGSHHIVVKDLFVPEDHTFNIQFGRPSIPEIFRYPFILWAFHIASIALGVAQGAMNDVLEFVQTKQRKSMRTTLAKTPLVQYRLGYAETVLRAARGFLYSEAKRILNGEEELDYISTVANVYANNAWVAQTCAAVVNTCFTLSGASSVYNGSPLQRRLRDIHTITQHASLNDNSVTRYGAMLLGEKVDMTY